MIFKFLKTEEVKSNLDSTSRLNLKNINNLVNDNNRKLLVKLQKEDKYFYSDIFAAMSRKLFERSYFNPENFSTALEDCKFHLVQAGCAFLGGFERNRDKNITEFHNYDFVPNSKINLVQKDRSEIFGTIKNEQDINIFFVAGAQTAEWMDARIKKASILIAELLDEGKIQNGNTKIILSGRNNASSPDSKVEFPNESLTMKNLMAYKLSYYLFIDKKITHEKFKELIDNIELETNSTNTIQNVNNVFGIIKNKYSGKSINLFVISSTAHLLQVADALKQEEFDNIDVYLVGAENVHHEFKLSNSAYVKYLINEAVYRNCPKIFEVSGSNEMADNEKPISANIFIKHVEQPNSENDNKVNPPANIFIKHVWQARMYKKILKFEKILSLKKINKQNFAEFEELNKDSEFNSLFGFNAEIQFDSFKLVHQNKNKKESTNELSTNEKIEHNKKKFKQYESFQGKVDFSNHSEVLNFVDYIYKDKTIRYNNISIYNKRLLPDFLSGAFAEMLANKIITVRVKKKIEAYALAIMANMDYQHYPTNTELNTMLDKKNNHYKNIIFVLGATPQVFSKEESIEIIKEYRRSQNPVIGFLEEEDGEFEKTGNIEDFISVQEFHKKFNDWKEANPWTKRGLGEALKKIGITSKAKYVKGKTIKVYEGIRTRAKKEKQTK